MELGLIVDIETTGLDPMKDSIIEIGLLQFSVEENTPPIITEMYSGIEDPGVPLSDEIKDITQLRDSVLKDRRIDWAKVVQFFDGSQVVIAHNVDFDARFLRRVPALAELEIHWACSVKHIGWHSLGFATRRLNYLAADHGFLNPFAHRALFDCATTFRLIAPHYQELVERSYEKEYRIFAVHSPFESKDLLKARHYRWDSEKRVWHKQVIGDSELEVESQYLVEKIYRGKARHEVEEVTNLY